jgi:M6 family metalloprotease-like protein
MHGLIPSAIAKPPVLQRGKGGSSGIERLHHVLAFEPHFFHSVVAVKTQSDQLPNTKCRSSRWISCLTGYLIVLASVLSAPYPQEGLLTDWTQPNGMHLVLRVYGDEFYARTTTDDGYTVVFDAADQTYYYATMAADGKSLISLGVAADQPPPAGLAKHLKEPKETASAVRAANIQILAPDRAANWRARVKAVQLQRSRAAGLAPAGELATAGEIAAAALAAPITGARVGLMILVQFPDDPETPEIDPVNFPATQAKIDRFCNEIAYTDDGNTGSIRDYFSDQSNGLLTHTQLVTAIVTLPHPRSFYNWSDYPTNTQLRGGPNPSKDGGSSLAGRMLVTDAVAILTAGNFDFSTLSIDSSNNIVATSLLFAGNTSGVWAQGLWPHASSLTAKINVGTAASPRYISRYQCTNVLNSAPVIGTVCHELGHLLMSYPDFYDTDESDGASAGVGSHCLMGGGIT